MATTIGNLLIKISADNKAFVREMEATQKGLQKASREFTSAGKTLTAGLTLPIIAAGGTALKLASDFESAFAGVRKTVNATEPQLEALRKGIRNMALEIPAAATEIAGIAEAAGQLGIETNNILSFTRVMADLGVTTNLSGEQAATSLARLANITQMSQTDFDRLGSTIVALGNNLATTEAEIVEMGLRLAGAGNQIGLSEAQILGFAGALSSVGINAEAGGSAFSRVMIQIASEVASGGKNLEAFAGTAGMTVQQFRQSFQQDAAGAIVSFVEGLGRMSAEGKDVFAVLDNLGLSEIRVRDAMLRASGAGDLFRESIELGSKAWEENTALTKEAAERYDTFKSNLEVLWNQLKEVGMTLGDSLIPIMKQAIVAVQPLIDSIQRAAEGFAKLTPEMQNTILSLLGLGAVIGPLLIALGSLAMFLSALLSPIGVVVASIAGIIAIGIKVMAHWDLMKKEAEITFNIISISVERAIIKIRQVFAGMELAAQKAIMGVINALQPLIKFLPESMSKSFAQWKSNLTQNISEVKGKLADLANSEQDNLIRTQNALKIYQSVLEKSVNAKVGFNFESKKLADNLGPTREALEMFYATGKEMATLENQISEIGKVQKIDFNKTLGLSEVQTGLANTGKEVENVVTAFDKLTLTSELAKAEFGLVKAQFGENATQSQLLVSELTSLTTQLQIQAQKVKLLQDDYNNMVKAKGEAAYETQQLRIELLKEQSAMIALGEQVQKNTNLLQQGIPTLQKAKDEVSNFESQVNFLSRRMEQQGEVVRGLEKEIKTIETAYKTTTDQIKDMERAISDTDRQFRDFGKAPLAEAKVLEDEMYRIEQQTVALELALLGLEMTKGPEEEAKKIKAQIDVLGKQAQQLRLREKLEIEPLRRELEALTSSTQYLTFDQARQGALDAQQKMAAMKEAMTSLVEQEVRQREQLTALESDYNSQKEALDNITEAHKNAESALRNFQSSIKSMTDMSVGEYDKLITKINEATEAMKEQLKVAEQAQKAVVMPQVQSIVQSASSQQNLSHTAAVMNTDAFKGMSQAAQKSFLAASGIPGFKEGGIVPGPMNAPKLIMAHGGEEVVPVGRRSGQTVVQPTVIVNHYGDNYGMLDYEQKTITLVRDALQGGAFRGLLNN